MAIVLRHFSGLSAAPDDRLQRFLRPIRYTERKSSKSRKVYPPHRMIALSDSVSLSVALGDSP